MRDSNTQWCGIQVTDDWLKVKDVVTKRQFAETLGRVIEIQEGEMNGKKYIQVHTLSPEGYILCIFNWESPGNSRNDEWFCKR